MPSPSKKGIGELTSATASELNYKGKYPVLRFRGVLKRADRLLWNTKRFKQLAHKDLLIKRCKNPKCMTLKHWETRTRTYEWLIVPDYGMTWDSMHEHRLKVQGHNLRYF